MTNKIIEEAERLLASPFAIHASSDEELALGIIKSLVDEINRINDENTFLKSQLNKAKEDARDYGVGFLYDGNAIDATKVAVLK